MGEGDWSDEENDAIVADYFAMLAADEAGLSYNKSARRRALRERIGRSEGSIEFKHCNVSAVLRGFGESIIPGYRPRFNVQRSLEDAVARWLARHPDWVARTPGASAPGFASDAALMVRPAPTLANAPPPEEAAQLRDMAIRRDVAERDARNRALGRAGEERVLAHEKATLSTQGRGDLADQVRWVADLDGDGAGFDVHSFTPEGRPRLIEVKTTNGWERTPFYISRNELAVSRENAGDWVLMRLWNFARGPRAFELRPPLERHVELAPSVYQATFAR